MFTQTHRRLGRHIVLGLLAVALTGCSLATPARMPEAGPSGMIKPEKPNPTLMERFSSPPESLTDVDITAGVLFEGINKEKWSQAQTALTDLQARWQQAKTEVGDKKGVEEADEALTKLTAAVAAKDIYKSYDDLNQFMGSVSDVAKNYKLSPLTDIIALGNMVRNVAYYTESKDWSKAASKVKELDDGWGQLKPAMEQVGILSEVTKTHAAVKQTLDAVNGENKTGVEEHIGDLNKSLGKIREFYRGK